MKKVLLIAVFAIFGLSSINAQEKGDFNAFGGATYDENFALTAGVEYLITDDISIAPSFTYFFVDKPAGATSASGTQLNIDARYYFGGTDELNWYGLVGYGTRTAKVSGGGVSVSASVGGLNVGAGGLYSISDSLNLIAQAKYFTGGDGAFVPTLGVQFGF
ncbi:MAG: outer membrane beta-barrel protein [Polaribacter sp.]